MNLPKFIIQQEKREALFALAGSSIIWGISAPIMKLLLGVAPLFLVAFLRFFVASLFFLLFKPNLRLDRQDIPKVIFGAIIAIGLHIPLFFYGLTLTSVTNAAMISAAGPLITLIFAREFLREKLRKNMFFGGMVGVAGFLLVFLGPIITTGVSGNLLGNAMLLLATLLWIYYEMLAKKLHKKYSTITISFYTFFIGGLVLLPFAFPYFYELPNLITIPVFVFGIIWGIIMTSFTAFFLWQWGLSKLEVSRVGFFAYLDPIVATLAALIILKETLSPQFLLGACFIFVGLYIAEGTIHLPHFHLRRIKV